MRVVHNGTRAGVRCGACRALARRHPATRVERPLPHLSVRQLPRINPAFRTLLTRGCCRQTKETQPPKYKPAQKHENKTGVHSPFLLTRLVHFLAALADIAELLSELQEPNLGADDLLFGRHVVSSNPLRLGAAQPRPLRAPPRLTIRRGVQDTTCQIKS